MKKGIGIMAGLMTVLFSSCVSMGYVAFDRLEAGEISFPEDIRRVGVVNNMLPFDMKQFGVSVDRLPELEGDGKVAAEALAQELAASDYFEEVLICDSALVDESASGEDGYRLSASKADSLIDAMGVDVLFSMDRVKIDLALWGDYMVYGDKYYSGVKGTITPVMFAYIPGRENPWFAVSEKDSVVWDGIQANLSLELFQKEGSEFAASMIVERLVPVWQLVERGYYASGNVEFRDANVAVQEQDWEEAYRLWKLVYDTRKGKSRMMAAYNLAVYSEAHDKPQEAIAYLQTALEYAKKGSADEVNMQIYLLELENRLGEKQRLDVQMKRFN